MSLVHYIIKYETINNDIKIKKQLLVPCYGDENILEAFKKEVSEESFSVFSTSLLFSESSESSPFSPKEKKLIISSKKGTYFIRNFFNASSDIFVKIKSINKKINRLNIKNLIKSCFSLLLLPTNLFICLF